MVLGWFKRPICFFCNQQVQPRPHNPRAFRCPECECWNNYAPDGEILSDEPAMHEESMNTAAFSKKGSPRNDKLPTMHDDTRVFCRSCQTNQTLCVNLLSNYLPEEEDPSYPVLLVRLPEYRESLSKRYPLVCNDCASNVEDRIKNSERLGRSKTLGLWLRDAKKESPKRVSPLTERWRAPKTTRGVDTWAWRAQGCLWVSSLLYSTFFSTQQLLNIPVDFLPDFPISRLTPPVALASVLWTFWDPLWLRRSQGIPIPPRSTRWMCYQFLTWISRIFVSSMVVYGSASPGLLRAHLCVETIMLLLFINTLWMTPSPTIRLLRSRSRTLTPYPTSVISTTALNPSLPSATRPLAIQQQPAHEFFSSLSLSTTPSLSHLPPKPIFGQTSAILRSATPIPEALLFDPPDAVDDDILTRRRAVQSGPVESMDWAPSSAGSAFQSHPGASRDWMRPQQFFPPASKPTGLESLLENTTIVDNSNGPAASSSAIRLASGSGRRKRGFSLTTYALLISVGCVGLILGTLLLWESKTSLNHFQTFNVLKASYATKLGSPAYRQTVPRDSAVPTETS